MSSGPLKPVDSPAMVRSGAILACRLSKGRSKTRMLFAPDPAYRQGQPFEPGAGDHCTIVARAARSAFAAVVGVSPVPAEQAATIEAVRMPGIHRTIGMAGKQRNRRIVQASEMTPDGLH